MYHIGILLYTRATQQFNYFILDKDEGKISVLSSRRDISRGALITYSLQQMRINTYVQNINIIDLPTMHTVSELIFFHQVLELSYYFIPLGKAVPDVFCLLLFLYTSLEKLHTTELRKLFLFKLLIHLGFYPDNQGRYMSLFQLIRAESIDAIISKTIDISLERKLDRWLDYCISSHPSIDHFKTTLFFIK